MASKPWEYPVFLIPHGGGYVSVVEPGSTPQSQALAVFTESDHSVRFMMQFEIMGTPRPIHNDREFGWLLQSLQAPVTCVAFDPAPVENKVNARWHFDVTEILEQHLTTDYSPWNYPVFIVAQENGFLCIDGQSSDGRAITAIGVFTMSEMIEEYFEASGESGAICELKNIDEARTLLGGLDENVLAVALNPQVIDQQRTAKHCFEIETILQKYLATDE